MTGFYCAVVLLTRWSKNHAVQLLLLSFGSKKSCAAAEKAVVKVSMWQIPTQEPLFLDANWLPTSHCIANQWCRLTVNGKTIEIEYRNRNRQIRLIMIVKKLPINQVISKIICYVTNSVQKLSINQVISKVICYVINSSLTLTTSCYIDDILNEMTD